MMIQLTLLGFSCRSSCKLIFCSKNNTQKIKNLQAGYAIVDEKCYATRIMN